MGVGVLVACVADTQNMKLWRGCPSLAASSLGNRVDVRGPDEIKEPQVIVRAVSPSAGCAVNAEDAQKSREGLPQPMQPTEDVAATTD